MSHHYKLNIGLLSTALFTALLISPAASVAAEFKRITTLDQFKANLVGRTIVGGGARMIIGDSGTVTGTARAGKVSLTWKWQGSFFCRTGTVGNEKLSNDCQQIWIKGRTVRFVRDRGTGSTAEYQIK